MMDCHQHIAPTRQSEGRMPVSMAHKAMMPGQMMDGGCRGSVECPGSMVGAIENCPIGIGYVPWQQWNQTYTLERGFWRGTIFPELDLPFERGGCR